MKRSNLTTKFMQGTVAKFEKSFKEAYKKENEKALSSSVIYHITIGVIQRKKMPDIEDVLVLIKLGNSGINDEQAAGILERYFTDEANLERGLLGAFCDACNDLCLDIPLNKMFVEQIKELEDMALKMQEVMSQLTNIMTKLTDFKSKAENIENKVDTIVETSETEAVANETHVEDKELGTKEDSTQE